MYYEEEIIDNKLMYRIKPDGEWIECKSSKAEVINTICKMDSETRADIFSWFCTYCGDIKTGVCYCHRDD
jgi:hypothetical protein